MGERGNPGEKRGVALLTANETETEHLGADGGKRDKD